MHANFNPPGTHPDNLDGSDPAGQLKLLDRP
jgi:hypothetical protein